MWVDEKGWRELSELHNDTLNASLEIAERCKDRLEASGKPGFEVRSVQSTFEAPVGPEDFAPGPETDEQ
jgi:hypothetical protein